MLDNIQYTKNEDGSFNKTVTHVEILPADHVASEISALQGQLADFQEGQQTDDIVLAISNYQKAIEDLQS